MDLNIRFAPPTDKYYKIERVSKRLGDFQYQIIVQDTDWNLVSLKSFTYTGAWWTVRKWYKYTEKHPA